MAHSLEHPQEKKTFLMLASALPLKICFTNYDCNTSHGTLHLTLKRATPTQVMTANMPCFIIKF